jgi:hypothetical protein
MTALHDMLRWGRRRRALIFVKGRGIILDRKGDNAVARCIPVDLYRCQ